MKGAKTMASAALIGCSPKFRALPGDLNEETLNLFDDDILSTSIFEEIVGSSEAILPRDCAGYESCSQ
jgi:hypothetical protein